MKNYELRDKIIKDATSQPDKELFIAEYGYPDWFYEINDDPEKVIEYLGAVHDIVNMPFKAFVQKTGMSQAKFAKRFCIPQRTVESWCMDDRKCPVYLRLALAEILEWI